MISYVIPLNLSKALSNENHYVPWDAARKHLSVNIHLLYETDVITLFKKYVSNLVDSTYTTLGWIDSGSHLQKLLRSDILGLACFSGHDACLSEAARLLNLWIEDASYSLPIGSKRQVYRRGIEREGSEHNWDIMWDRCMAELSPAEIDNLHYGLSNSQDRNILKKYIRLSQDVTNVRTQDFLKILEYISINPAGSELVWSWVRENWEWLVKRYTLNDRYLGQVIPNITKHFATKEKLDEMKEFFGNYPEAGAGERFRKQALETVRSNIRWVDTNANTILQWLNNL